MYLNDLIQFYEHLDDGYENTRKAVEQLILKEWRENVSAPDTTAILSKTQ